MLGSELRKSKLSLLKLHETNVVNGEQEIISETFTWTIVPSRESVRHIDLEASDIADGRLGVGLDSSG